MNQFTEKSFSGITNVGFTLIELLVVVLIIGILASVALPQYYKARDKACALEIRDYFKTLEEAGHLFTLANGRGPLTLDELVSFLPRSFAKMDIEENRLILPLACYQKRIKISFGVVDGDNWQFGAYIPNYKNHTIVYQFFKSYGFASNYLSCGGSGTYVDFICPQLTGATAPTSNGSYIRP